MEPMEPANGELEVLKGGVSPLLRGPSKPSGGHRSGPRPPALPGVTPPGCFSPAARNFCGMLGHCRPPGFGRFRSPVGGVSAVAGGFGPPAVGGRLSAAGPGPSAPLASGLSPPGLARRSGRPSPPGGRTAVRPGRGAAGSPRRPNSAPGSVRLASPCALVGLPGGCPPAAPGSALRISRRPGAPPGRPRPVGPGLGAVGPGPRSSRRGALGRRWRPFDRPRPPALGLLGPPRRWGPMV